MQEELLNIAREKASKQICLSLLEEGVVHDLQDIAAEVLEEEKAERDAKLQELASIVIRRRTARYFKRYSISNSSTSSLVFLKRVDTTLFSMIRLGVLVGPRKTVPCATSSQQAGGVRFGRAPVLLQLHVLFRFNCGLK